MVFKADRTPSVPAPEPPDSADAWYAPDVRAQYESYPGVVATVRERRDAAGSEFSYETRGIGLMAEVQIRSPDQPAVRWPPSPKVESRRLRIVGPAD